MNTREKLQLVKDKLYELQKALKVEHERLVMLRENLDFVYKHRDGLSEKARLELKENMREYNKQAAQYHRLLKEFYSQVESYNQSVEIAQALNKV